MTKGPSSSQETVLRLFPGPGGPVPLRGLYLDKSLRPSGTPARPCVYASFIASLDGRISLPDPETKVRKVPRAIANPRDWRLVQELAAAADVLVTSGRYIRDLAAGVAQDNLPVSDKPEFADLHEWRRARSLTPQPAVAIVTGSLDLPIPEALLHSGRAIYIATGAAADTSRIKSLAAQGVRVLKADNGTRVEGRALIAALAQEGFGNIDMTAGSVLLNALLTAGVLNCLYLTQACRILGGRAFETLYTGEELHPPADFKLRSLFYDAAGNGGIEQLFSVFDYRAPRAG
ncbi:MAG: dihydrofolate reductase family protein [Gammaproteobacteria bacterium]|nr:dihydrofolate reductase family protein [Gammaproteobacteria bacterium]